MKKLITILLVLVFVMSFAVTALADPVKNDSITINNAKPGETYSLYKLFDLSVDNEITPAAHTYTVNSAWEAFFRPAEGTTPAGPGNQYISVNAAGSVTNISDAAALAKAAAEWSGKPATPVQSVTVPATGTTAVFSNLPDGYWLVTSTLGTVAMTETTPDASAVTINEKNPEDTIAKTVKEDSADSFGESNDAQIGDTVYFKSTVTIVKGTRNVVVHDKMDTGLTFTSGSVSISGLTLGTDYTVNESPTDGDTFDITFSQAYIDTIAATHVNIEITYSAKLNANAVVVAEGAPSIVAQNNKTHVTFGDNTSSVEATTTTTTHKFSLYKHAKGATENLAGAVFELKKNGTVISLIKLDDNNYRVAMPDETGAVTSFTTVAGGDIVIWGVDADDDYTLHETAAPGGYNPLTSEVPVTVDADNSTRIDVENQSGSQLPPTGGIGTTLFYLFGGLLAAGAAVVLVAKKRSEQ